MAAYLCRCHLVPGGSRTSKERAALFWLARPTENSITMMGSPKIIKKNR